MDLRFRVSVNLFLYIVYYILLWLRTHAHTHTCQFGSVYVHISSVFLSDIVVGYFEEFPIFRHIFIFSSFCSFSTFLCVCAHNARSGFAVKRRRYAARICVNINVKYYCKYVKCKWTLDTYSYHFNFFMHTLAHHVPEHATEQSHTHKQARVREHTHAYTEVRTKHTWPKHIKFEYNEEMKSPCVHMAANV